MAGTFAIPHVFPSLWNILTTTVGWPGVILFVAIVWTCFGLMLVHYLTLGFHLVKDRLGFARATPVEVGAPNPEPTQDLTFGFVVAVYNDGLTIGPCIESLLRQSRRPDEIVVVNDGSTDGTREAIEAFRDRGVTILHLEKNGGKKAAVEAGLRAIGTDLVAITDADCIVHEDYAKEIATSFRDPKIAAVSGVGESIPHSPVTAARQIEYMFFYGVCQPAESRTDSIVVLVGNCSTYRRSVLLEIGFDHPTISEDISATFRLHELGHKMTLNRKAKVYVSDPPTFKAYYHQLVRWYTDYWICVKSYSRLWGRKHFGRFELPHLTGHMTAMSLFWLGFPIVLLLLDPIKLIGWFAISLAIDIAIVAVAYVIYGRRDLWWGALTRLPTRTIGNFVWLLCMARVLTNTHGMAWKKLERRGTAHLVATEAKAGAALRP